MLEQQGTTTLDGVRRKVFDDRYALRDDDGRQVEQGPEEMWDRVARAIAAAEATPTLQDKWTARFYDLLSGFKFVPGGRILSGAGTGHEVTFYNCFVVAVGESPYRGDGCDKPELATHDARPAFFRALAEMTDIMARSGGVGLNLSALPPRGTPIGLPGRGLVARPRITVALSVAHPDVLDLLNQKDSPLLSCVDIAVLLTPAFHAAVAQDAPWTFGWTSAEAEGPAPVEGVTLPARAVLRRLEHVEGRRVQLLGDKGCYAVPDSREGIIAAALAAAEARYRGESITLDFSALRPQGAHIKTVNGTSSGPISWMYLFDAVSRLDDGVHASEKGVIHFAEIASTITGKTIQQGGTRRGALMIMLNDDHPDVCDFITAKRIDPDTGKPVMIEHANMSVCVSDAFMTAVDRDLPWDLRWNGRVVRTLPAREIWNKICEAAHTTAEPGVVFMQRCQETANTWYYERINCVNPCGEQPLPPGGVCNLGAMNLAAYVNDIGELQEDKLAEDTQCAIRFLDNVIDVTPYFSDLNREMQKEGTRRTGLGIMGLADMLIKMGLRYGSAPSLVATERACRIIRDAAYRASVALAREKGVFPRFDAQRFLEGAFIKLLPADIRQGIADWGIRNGVLLTVAPTGTTSLLAGVSSGIEPVFSFVTKRTDRLGEHILYHPLAQAWKDTHPGEELPTGPDSPFVEAHTLTPEEHVRVQASVQWYVDASISKCLAGETLVLTERGLLPIGDLYGGEAADSFRPLGMRLASLGQPGEQVATHFYYGGQQQTKTVRLADGHVITGTPNHRVLVGTAEGLDWKRLDELAPGDYVSLKLGGQLFGPDVSLRGFKQSATQAGYQHAITTPASMMPMLAHFVGAWCADGGFSHYTVHITKGDRSVLERLSAEAEQLFGLPGRIAPEKKGHGSRLVIHSKSLCEFLRFLGCVDGSPNKVVPWAILQSSRESQVAFLSGLYLDGFVTASKVGICLAAQELISQLQVMLDNLGVQAWITAKYNPQYERDYYELNAHGQEGQRLARLLAFDEAHKRERALTLQRRSFGSSKSDVVPLEVRGAVFAHASTAVRQRHHWYSQAVSGRRKDTQLSWSGLRRLANDPDVPLTDDLRTVVHDNLHFRTVRAVEEGGLREVYDLTVPATQAFVGNGVVNHNTSNAPHDHTVAAVDQLYRLAYALGCKGVTYYRDGSRDAVLTVVKEEPPAEQSTALVAADEAGHWRARAQAAEERVATLEAELRAVPADVRQGRLKTRPEEVAGYTRGLVAPEGSVHTTINHDPDGPIEVFVNVGRAGSDLAAIAEAMGRLCSLVLRLPSTMTPQQRMAEMAAQLRGIGGGRPVGFGPQRVLSLPDALSQLMEGYLERHGSGPDAVLPPSGTAAVTAVVEGVAEAALVVAETAMLTAVMAEDRPRTTANGNGKRHTGNLCPQCGCATLVRAEGCKHCEGCGHSEC